MSGTTREPWESLFISAMSLIDQCRTRERVVRAQYEEVDVLDFQLTFAESLKIAEHVLLPLIV